MSAKKINTEAVVDAVTAAVEAVVEAAPKKASTRKTAAKKTTTRKTTAKKAEGEAKKTTKKTVVTMNLEMASKSLEISEIQAAVEKAVMEQGLKAAELKIYINTAEQAAYYTLDGEGSAEYRVDLTTL